MGIRPAKCYNKINKKPYTRISQRRPRKSYVRGVPASKIHQFQMGNIKGDFPQISYLVAKQDVQLRTNCMESVRVVVSKHLAKNLGDTGFFMKIMVYPHHILRENAMATGAGADRFSQGMRQSFGIPTGQAARVYTGQKIIMVKTPAGKDEIIKEAFRRGKSKLSGTWLSQIG
ncbi:MAG: 50S ribosomal protein L16 [Nanoarchaeota archaeon]|nr:50S ribosomal protein L16 [Nanoarchaeota archaeon]MBU4124550.1 50S ribosomal protein L16 [Nanoarchaeota archaeon]